MAALYPDRVQGEPPARNRGIGLSRRSEFDQFAMPRVGMQLPRGLPYEKWLGIGRQLAAVSSYSAWCLGDWLIHGEDVFCGRYRDAIEQTALDYQTLRNYAWVARRFTLSRRRDTLSFAHHAEVARLPEHEQDFWLRKAEELSWSRNRLRQEVRASLAERVTADDLDTACASLGEGQVEDATKGIATTVAASSSFAEAAPRLQVDAAGARIQINLSSEQLEYCQAAADRLGRSVEEWAALALDRAAQEELSHKNRS